MFGGSGSKAMLNVVVVRHPLNGDKHLSKESAEQDRAEGSIVGLAVGDAVGTTLEFETRDSYKHIDDMVGGGPFSLSPGQWTDDTSMALCLATSLLECKGFNARDQMERYCRWNDEGYLSSTGACFDIGNTVSSALNTFRTSGEPMSGPSHAQSAGNGSLMRLAPVVVYYYPDKTCAVQFSRESSRTTHGVTECLDACELFAEMLCRAISGADKAEVLSPIALNSESDRLNDIASMSFTKLTRDQVRGTGYVVDSLEAALWSFAVTGNYRDATLMAANLGDDADTTAAICGQIAGAFYGLSGIPDTWLSKLTWRDQISELAGQLYV